ncbi:zinc-ribbon domain-containing protein [Myxococcus stipitatus]|uniref:zinc-ribbon domain-containing protein n=1 Tax=Myxococcus stipitatus TaxID=83455 RepID=UPI001F4634EF|nr:zinc-ribbon domain-containing protein [Myxococcus stipitatus]MCE9667196.1 zinc-ribbon domain-containing protein [Myxococcus stipitatus]
MRIVCQKCAAAYAIDDRLITAKGVRAQCPRCRNLQLVRRDSSAVPSADVPAPAARPATPTAGAQPASPSTTDELLGGDAGSQAPTEVARPAFGGGAAPAPNPAADLFADFGAIPAPKPASSPPVDPFAGLGAPAESSAPGADPLLDFLGPAPAAPPAPVARVSSAPGAVPVSVAPPAAGRAPAAPAAKPATMGCRACNKPLTDPFDQALGTCDECRQREAPSSAPRAKTEPPPAAASTGAVDFLPPLSSPEEGDGSGTLEVMPRGVMAPPLGSEPRSNPRNATAPELGAEPRSGQRAAAGSAPRNISGIRSGSAAKADAGSRSGGRWVALGGLGVLLVAGGGGYLFHAKQEAARSEASKAVAPAIPEAIQAVLPRWKLKYLELEGTSSERLAQGQAQLARDERFAYAEAEESFQQALLLDPRSDAAIAGYVQAVALGRGAGLDEPTFQEARSLVEASESRAGRTAPLLLAHANLLLTRTRQAESMEQAKALAKEALAHAQATDAQKAEAHLVLGRAFLASSRGLASASFDSAQALAPGLKRIQFYRALAHESAGEYRLALETLRKRLAEDPKDWDSLAAISRLYQEVGEASEARKLYEARVKADAGELRALLPLAVLRYQAENNAAAGVRELRALLKNRGRYGERDVADVLVHLSAAERAVGNSDAGAKAAEEALGLVKDLSSAHLQLFLVALEKKDAAKAREHLPGIQGRLEDTALEMVLEGRLLLLEQKPLEAMERFQSAAQLDSRRLDARLLEGVAAMAAKRREDAFRVLNQALNGDPLRLEPRQLVTRFWMRPAETVKGVEGIIHPPSERSEDPSRLLYEGLIRFHQGDLDVADRLFRDVLESDANNAGALSYRALIALRRDNTGEARTLAARAVASGGRLLPVANLAQGLALAQDGRQVEPAKRSLRDALGRAPTMLSAKARLAELEVPQRREAARAELVSVVGLDSTYLPAKRMLYQLER